MLRYLKLIVVRALSRSVLLSDRMSIMFGVLTPAILHVAGDAMQDTVLPYISWFIIVTVSLGVVLRFFAAPYFIWREDQKIISDLKLKLSAPEYGARTIVQQRLAEESVQLSDLVASAAEQIIGTRSETKCLEVLASCRPKFIKHGVDETVKASWRTFENLAFAYAGGFPSVSKSADKIRVKSIAATHERNKRPGFEAARDGLIKALLYVSKNSEWTLFPIKKVDADNSVYFALTQKPLIVKVRMPDIWKDDVLRMEY